MRFFCIIPTLAVISLCLLLVSANGPGPNNGCNNSRHHCDDLVEHDILDRWSWGATDVPPATTELSVLGPDDNVVQGRRALRATTTSGFDFWVRYTALTPIDASHRDELRVAVRGHNTTPLGWQGNFPALVVEDTTGARARFDPDELHLSRDGITWSIVTVPLAGGAGWTKTGSVNWRRVRAVEIHADTWDFGFTLDVDGLNFKRSDEKCTYSL